MYISIFTNYIKLLILSIISILFVIGILLLMPGVTFYFGNLFFGGNPNLYNVTLAQFFYSRAVHSPISEAPEFAHYQLSRTYFIQGFFNRAIEEANTEILLYPENKRTYYILGLTYGYMNREEEAIESFSEFIKHYPSSWAAHNDKAWLQFQIGDIEGAITTLEPLSGNLNPWIQNTWGTLLMNSGRTEEARDAFLRARDLISEMSEYEWGMAYPGNDPRIYGIGLSAMQQSIETNIAALEREGGLSPD